jgi:hypothetical protein
MGYAEDNMTELKDMVSLIAEIGSTLEELSSSTELLKNTEENKNNLFHKNIAQIININHETLKRVIIVKESVEHALSYIEYAHGIAELVEQSSGPELFNPRQKVVIDALATFTLDSRNALKNILGHI